MKNLKLFVWIALLLVNAACGAQEQPPAPASQNPPQAPMQMIMPGMNMGGNLTLSQLVMQHSGSGTSVEPAAIETPMWMGISAGWMLMLHGNGFGAGTFQYAADHAGPSAQECATYGIVPCPANEARAQDGGFSTNWVMGMAMRDFGRQQLTVRTMLSAEPATIRDGYYPELFQQGEVYDGSPIVDGQHPHDFFMEVAALYDVRLSDAAVLSFYAAPIGDPAIGPTAYPHRTSASEDPIAALGHHQEDSTHIAFNVITGGLTWKWFRVEESGFHGGEPDDHRWAFQPSWNGHAVDSFSTRVTVAPTSHLLGQYSWASIHTPEQLAPTENQDRQTASISYSRHDGTPSPASVFRNVDATLVWGHTNDAGAQKENSYLAEVLTKPADHLQVWTRIENAARSSELLFPPGSTLPPDFSERTIGHVAAYSLGVDREFRAFDHLGVAPGVQGNIYRAPDALVSTYGRVSGGFVIFVRVRVL